jgi:diguanylate cyclase (GGDEF)-like protein/PAS domain S-box-containing protein
LSNTRLFSRLAALSVMLVVAAATFVLDRSEQARLNQKARAAVLQQLGTARARLEGGVNSRLLLGRGLVSYVSTHPDIDEKQFRELARVLIARQDGIRTIELVHGTTIRYIYPLKGNESALGLDLMARKNEKSAIERAIASRTIAVAGPLPLVEGGTAFISREPIFLTPPNGPPESGVYWGLGQILIDRDFLFDEAGMGDKASNDLLYAARGMDGLGIEGKMIWGDAVLFKQDPVTMDVLLPNGSWRIAALPKGGWPAPDTRWIRVGGALLALISGLLIWFLLRMPLRLRVLVEKATASLRVSERKFRDIAETIPVAVFVSRQSDGEILFANENLASMFGLAPGEAVGRNTAEFCSDREKLQEVIANQGSLKDFEQLARKSDGTPFWCAISLRPIVFDNLPAFLVALLDITERKQAEEKIQTLNRDLEQRVQERTEALAGSNQQLMREAVERQRAEEALRAEHEFSQALLKAQSDAEEGMYVIQDGRVIFANEAITRLTGYSNRELLEDVPFIQLAHPDVREGILDKLHRRLAGEQFETRYETVFQTKTGERREVEVAVATLKVAEKIRILVVARDITERKRQEERLRIYKAAINAAADSVVITDRAGIIEYANPAFTRTTGYALEEALGQTPALLKSGTHDKEFYRKLWGTLLAGREWKGEIVNRRKNGALYHEEMTVAPVKDANGDILRFVAVKRDVTARKHLEQRLQRMAHYDDLTGLPNRTLFFDRLDYTLAQAKRNGNLFALLFIDLDGFKRVNDTLGHEAGDNLLQEVAKRLTQCVRESDTVARVGGDEFAIILSGIVQATDAGQIAEKIIEALGIPIFPGTLRCKVGASIGISLFPTDGVDRETLLNRADAAMYRTKEQGKNAYSYYSTSQVAPL